MGVRERKEREREQRRLDILSSARQAFEKHGLQHTSMDRIAEEAELSKGTLYLYYKNRNELLMALVAEDLEQLIGKLKSVSRSKERADKKLLKAVTMFHTFSAENEFFYRVMTQMDVREMFCCEAGEQPSESAVVFKNLNEEMMDLMMTLVQEGVDTGIYHIEHPVRYVVLQLVFALKGTMLIIRNGLVPPEWAAIDAAKVMHDTAALFIRGLTCPLQSEQHSTKPTKVHS